MPMRWVPEGTPGIHPEPQSSSRQATGNDQAARDSGLIPAQAVMATLDVARIRENPAAWVLDDRGSCAWRLARPDRPG
jgi:hypothetical protein